MRDQFRRDPTLPMLIGDDIFVKGIRKGIEQGEYVYRRGELLYGQGNPAAAIQIDEQAVVFTMAYAKEQGIWPRPQPKSEFPPEEIVDPPVEVTKKPGQESVDEEESVHVPPPAQPFHAEGVLREALIRLWEQARVKKVERLGALAIRVFDAADGFRLLGVVAAVKAAEGKQVFITGGYETTAASRLEIDFTGTPQDAAPLKDFLDAQLRAATQKTVQVRFDLTFAAGLPMTGDAAEKLTEQLTRFATGAAYVEATATVAIPPVMEAAE